MTNYLIFGGAGFIGRNYCDFLLASESNTITVFDNLSMGNQIKELEDRVKLIVGDMSDDNLVLATLEREKPGVVIHLAANSDISAAVEDPLIDVKNTFETTLALTKALAHQHVPTVIFASSSAIFGQVTGPISESTKPNPVSPYGWMKLTSERLLEKSLATGAMESLLIVRFPNLTGRWQTHGVVHDLYKKLETNGETLEVLGDGSQLKPYANPEDLITDIQRIFELKLPGLTSVLLAPKDQISVSEIAEELVSMTGKDLTIKYGERREGWVGDVPEYSFDCSFAESLAEPLSFKPSIEAIRESIAWEISRTLGY